MEDIVRPPLDEAITCYSKTPRLTQENKTPMRLNLGAGAHKIAGYKNLDIKDGYDVRDLEEFEDNSIEEIRASHILEHFGHGEVVDIVSHWVEKLAPGGVLKIAVPDLAWILDQYKKKSTEPLQSYLMGGQVDGDDYHKSVYDFDSLRELLYTCGLERIGRWTDDAGDCASLPVSLNLQGFKPTEGTGTQKVAALLSAPRFSATIHFQNAFISFQTLKIPYYILTGAYWHQVLSEGIERIRGETDIILTCDYDSVFSNDHVLEMLRLMCAYPEADAIFPVQYKRQEEKVLGKPVNPISQYDLAMNLCPMKSGHFGLTAFRAEVFEKLNQPWFLGVPNEYGTWGDGKIDADVYFWQKFQEAGLKCYMASKVCIGHVQEMIVWPGPDYRPIYQDESAFKVEGPPAGAGKPDN